MFGRKQHTVFPVFPDAEFDLEHVDGIVSVERHEEETEFWKEDSTYFSIRCDPLKHQEFVDRYRVKLGLNK